MAGIQVTGLPRELRPISGGLVDVGVKTTSDGYFDGHLSLVAPVFSSLGSEGTLGGSLVFLEPYMSWGEQGEIASSLGLGFRHLFNRQPVSALRERHVGLLDEGIYIGGSGFLDLLDTRSDNRFWQVGLGAEVGARYFELSGNYYHPLTSRQEGRPYMERNVRRGELLTSADAPFATGHTILQDVTFTTYDFYTDRIFRYYEEGMRGWDMEGRLLVPGLDRWCELWLRAGYGSFDNQPFGPQIAGTGEVAGWKAGVEFRPIPEVVLSAMCFEDEAMAGGQWVYGLSLQIPLDPEPANEGKSWWRRLKDELRPGSRHVAERMNVPVRRQNAAVKIANSIGEPEVRQYAKAISKEERRVVVRDDVIFVNNGGPQGNGIGGVGVAQDGTAERPFDTVGEGINLAATTGFQVRGVPTVYVAGGGASYSGLGWFGEVSTLNEFRMPSGVHLVSGGYGIGAFGGRRFGLGTAARIAVGERLDIGNPNESMLSKTISVDGFRFELPVVISAQNVNVRGNQTTDLFSVHAFNAVVTGNEFAGPVGISASGNGFWAIRGPSKAVVSGNTFSPRFDGIGEVIVQDYDQVTFTDNSVFWETQGNGLVPPQPTGAVLFLNVKEVGLGGNRILVTQGERPNPAGTAAFQFDGMTELRDLGNNEVISPGGTRPGFFGVYGGPYGFHGRRTLLNGAIRINGIQLGLNNGSGFILRLP